ncbi:pentatricopeptide repeat-containing protein at4g13650 [Phtheirospermum japonicum]|uniref:Pentatricopeptide repeat-containing protein at4g13650 n=1 Tax=Phtheirospermum japonicum TaxID=374723 RepID=A0A830D264_9LAMI|nr:pentatricopeptide repeat-containing protein at4g13650 [Phtheirospermum japonicum]
MRNPPRAVIHGFFSTFHGVPRRFSTFSPSKNCISYSLGLGSPLSTVALRTSGKPSWEFSHRRNPKKIRSWRESNEPQRCYLEVSVDRGMSMSRSPIGGLESVNVKNKLKWYSVMLRDCAAEIRLSEGKVIHGCIIRSGIEPDLHLWVSLINFYAKCGVLALSLHVFEQMSVKDVVSWTALISGFVAQGRGMESVELFCEMRREDVRPNEFTLATILKGCSLSSDLEFGKQVHAVVVKIGLLSDVYIGSSLIDLYSKCGEMEYADDVFCMMPEKNAVSWNTLLNGYAQAGNGEAVLRLFCKMEEPEMRFSNYTLSIVLKGVASSGAFRAGEAIHSIVIKVAGELDDFVRCSLLNMYSKCGVADDALKLFKTIKSPDIVAWSSIISVADQQGQKEEAAKLFNLMRHFGVRPNEFTLSSLVSAATDLGDLRYGQSIHACAHKFGFDSDNLVSNALVSMYMKFRSTNDGYLIFNKMANRDVISWNALLSGFHDETSDHGTRHFRQMLMDGFRPNMYTFISILRCCSSLLNIEFGKQVHSHIIKDNLVGNGYVGTVLIDMYAKCGCMEDVEVIFSRLNEKDAFTWTVIISGYSQTNQGEKAVRCFNQMRREGVIPNEFTLASCLKGCSAIASLENGRQFHSLAIKSGQSTDMFVSSALIDMYGKCGYIDDAEIVFEGMRSRDTVLWNTIICGYSQHGEGDKALQAFTRMINDGVLPDTVTFVGILSACSHMGYVEEGQKHFYSMKESYGFSPSIEHYACLVDILGRAGNFDEVESLIQHLEPTPNALIWENVLGACKAHGNVELGERAAEKLFEIDPETDSNYILLSNLYASRGRWNDVSRVRALMSDKGIKKEPGCSWVEVDAQVHVFLSQDASHPRLLDIHRKLDELGQRVTKAGYVPNTNNVLHNVTEKEKVDNLFNHSERLALGFALINKVSGKRIRIFKNLRICGDCHEFIKFVSGTMNQEIVVRDTSRFHHFRQGSCSCKEVLYVCRNADAVCFDVDSAVCLDEGMDELAEFGEAGEAVAEWTARLSPGIDALVEKLKEKNKTVYLVSGSFRQMKLFVPPQYSLVFTSIFYVTIPKTEVLTGQDHFLCSLLRVIVPFSLRIVAGQPARIIYIANGLVHVSSGEFSGFDSSSGGKATFVLQIRKDKGYNSLVMIGDGATYLEVRIVKSFPCYIFELLLFPT